MRLAAPMLALAVTLAGCGTTGKFVWVDDYAAPEKDQKGYVIVPGDVILVRVFNQDAVSGRLRVRRDGKVSVPFLNDVTAAGYAPSDLAHQLQTRLKEFIKLPVVTVTIEETRQVPVSLLGEVAKPGQYQLEEGAGVLQALAVGGGLTDFAHRDRIFVVRKSADEVTRIRFIWRNLAQGEGRAAAFHLKPGDVIVVE
jgi:polysaccharide export outer membrane protein